MKVRRTIGVFVSDAGCIDGLQLLTSAPEGLAPTTPKNSRTADEWYSAGGTLMSASPASSADMSPLGQQIMANVRRKRYGP